MLIGLDFDNTLAHYDSVFAIEAKKQGLVSDEWRGTKRDLKNKLHSIQNGGKLWQKIQGQVYGPSMYKADLFPGVARFLLRCKLQGHTILIISHKTRYGHFDPTKTLLREAALSWMDDQGFFDDRMFGLSRKNVFFEATRQEKVERIESLNLDVFVDDLEEVFAEENFPSIKKILFSNTSKGAYHDIVCNNWPAIANSIVGEITDKEIGYLASSICKNSIQNIKKIQGRGNSRLYKISTDEMGDFVLKDYPDLLIDPRERLMTEVHALKMVEHLQRTPKVVAFDKEQNIALYEWIEGAHLTHIRKEHISQALGFIENIQSLENRDSYPLASEACLSADHIFSQINHRFQQLLLVKNQVLQNFLNTTFKPLWDEVHNWSEQHWPKRNLVNDLPKTMQVFSPSDFGFHNALLKNDGEICFLDFEYFGRDDPVKLMADFIWHPGMNLNFSHKAKWLKETFRVFGKDPDLYSRFHAAWPLYGLRWSLILLNEFREDGWNKRVYANTDLESNHEKRLDEQLVKAASVCEQIQITNMKCPYV